MEYRYLGNSGLHVSRLVLGTMMFGQNTDAPTSRRIISSALENGVNFIDTADVYNGGESERVVGSAIKEKRDQWVLATKFGGPMGPGLNNRGQSRSWIIDAAEASLRRLDTDYIDILYFHRSFEDAALPQAVRAVGDLIRQGKVRYFGLSNFPAWKLGLVCKIADEMNIDRPIVSQPVYSIVERTVEREHFPAARHYGVGVVSYSPLARGVLTGKYHVGADPDPESRAGRNDMRLMQTEWRPESLSVATVLAEHAAKKKRSLIDFAVAWVLASDSVTAVIGGPRTEDQWNAYLSAVSTKIDEDDEALVNSLVSPGHTSTPGYNDPSYPVEPRNFRAST